ncbi:MAG: arginine decarboxylase [Flavobacteriales bacterium]|nr:arginine decarboxylase [Flavobacteriales bacterium]MCB9191606.1 arginine decarboxylase [Flavobacteriales bacterium]
MENTYRQFIEQSVEFPQDAFEVKNDALQFHGIDLMALVKEYGTPLKLNYLPSIGQQIEKARRYFDKAIDQLHYRGNYTYCYCTKSSHFSFVLDEVLKSNVELETSSAYDIYILRRLFEQGKINKETLLVHNGYKRELYAQLIADLINDGFNSVPVLDNQKELELFKTMVTKPCNIGIRIATGEEPQSNYYTARLGLRHRRIQSFYEEHIADSELFNLKMLHFFIDNGIEDSLYYWNELDKCLGVYCKLKRVCPTLDSLNIGGGFPVKQSLAEEFDYKSLTFEIVSHIKRFCEKEDIEEPNLLTEFGSYTVAESGATIYSIIDQKKQNDVEWWNMIDSSFITTLPDSWAINKRFILLAINNWDEPYERVNLGGLTCDNQDYYNVEAHVNNIYLPKYNEAKPLCIGFFNTGAYQNALGGYGGIQHCLIPSPKQILVERDEKGQLKTSLFAPEQGPESMLKTLGY